ncbi:MAG: hypothetical protein COV48_14040 [Elusimicrobia bacterium CG11_big_fil_rev_8_21_14_0_20_64_6]|nr:MAG: hypothetical protein COV48_14040 [Elusimicrobia bacterium CG11_big_fil_rev_8_21_14_0_20_64_6]
MSRPHDSASAAVSRTLTVGVGASMTLMAGGLALALLHGGPLPADATPLPVLGTALRAGEPVAFMSLGLMILLATPAVRVLVLTWQFARRREWVFVVVSLTVLGVLAASVVIGRGE